MDLGYARIGTPGEGLELQIDALTAAGVAPEHIYVDTKSGSGGNGPGLRALIGGAREGDVIVVHTLDRLGRRFADLNNLIYELTQRGVQIRNLDGATPADSSGPDDATA